MAVTISRYNHTLNMKNKAEIDWDSMKVMLLADSATFDRTDATLDDVAGVEEGELLERAHEVYGNGWAQGGILIEAATWSAVAADLDTYPNDSMLDADDVSETATGGPIGPARKAVIYDSAHEDLVPLFFIDFGEDQQAGEDTDFKIVWSSNGIYRERDYPA